MLSFHHENTGAAEFPLKLGGTLTLVFLAKIDYEHKRRPRLANTIVREIPGSKQTEEFPVRSTPDPSQCSYQKGVKASISNKPMAPGAQR